MLKICVCPTHHTDLAFASIFGNALNVLSCTVVLLFRRWCLYYLLICGFVLYHWIWNLSRVSNLWFAITEVESVNKYKWVLVMRQDCYQWEGTGWTVSLGWLAEGTNWLEGWRKGGTFLPSAVTLNLPHKKNPLMLLL